MVDYLSSEFPLYFDWFISVGKGYIKSLAVKEAMILVDRKIFVKNNPYQDSPQKVEEESTAAAPRVGFVGKVAENTDLVSFSAQVDMSYHQSQTVDKAPVNGMMYAGTTIHILYRIDQNADLTHNKPVGAMNVILVNSRILEESGTWLQDNSITVCHHELGAILEVTTVTWAVLATSNKPHSSHFRCYTESRNVTVRGAVIGVQMKYPLTVKNYDNFERWVEHTGSVKLLGYRRKVPFLLYTRDRTTDDVPGTNISAIYYHGNDENTLQVVSYLLMSTLNNRKLLKVYSHVVFVFNHD
ncbi:unnamed protein product [Trichobilharzia regenti]|nr:unnamed protein product [Trichobilharzia regenti]